MAEICCEVLSDNEKSPTIFTDPNSRSSRPKMEIQNINMVPGSSSEEKHEIDEERQKLEPIGTSSFVSGEDDTNSVTSYASEHEKESHEVEVSDVPLLLPIQAPYAVPLFGFSSISGRRAVMEDAVTIRTSFCHQFPDLTPNLHYFGVYDGHGCSHVATRCREKLHKLVEEELENIGESLEWERVMERSFNRMDQEVCDWDTSLVPVKCRCEPQTTDYEAVGSTAIVAIVTPDKIIVANCGDSRAVLSRNGIPIPLSSDHKPDRPDELQRIEALGGRVIYWDGARVLGVLAMSRAIGDKYLKPYVNCVPEVMIIDRTAEDECLILASDGLWDVVPNETACGVARMCVKGNPSDMACTEASTLLTKIALARDSLDNISVLVVDLSGDAEMKMGNRSS